MRLLTREDYPALEYDDQREAKLEPSRLVDRPFDTDRLVITFFPEAMESLRREGLLETERVIPGENPVTVCRFTDRPQVLITLGQVGCPACGGNLDLFHAMGIRKVLFCGGGGVLERSIAVGQLLLVEGAIRDEAFSCQYVPPSRVLYTDPAVTDRVAACLSARGVPFLRGLTWTTDAIFRETPDRIARRRAEGARIVEMEQSGNIAVAQYRGFDYAALIYGGDDLSGEQWTDRGWNTRRGIRYDLVLLCRDLAEQL